MGGGGGLIYSSSQVEMLSLYSQHSFMNFVYSGMYLSIMAHLQERPITELGSNKCSHDRFSFPATHHPC